VGTSDYPPWLKREADKLGRLKVQYDIERREMAPLPQQHMTATYIAEIQQKMAKSMAMDMDRMVIDEILDPVVDRAMRMIYFKEQEWGAFKDWADYSEYMKARKSG